MIYAKAFAWLWRKDMFDSLTDNSIWRAWMSRIFPVRIHREGGVLRIEDRRPSDGFVLAVIIAAFCLISSAMISPPLVGSGIYWPVLILVVPGIIFAVRICITPVRATYLFDKEKDSYSVIQGSLLRKQCAEGSVSQIRGVQVERRVVTSSDDSGTSSREIYRPVLLLKQGLLFGTPDVVPLREDSTVDSSYETATQIAAGITSYLNLGAAQSVDL